MSSVTAGQSVDVSKLFTPVKAGAVTLRNRLVMAPMTRNRASIDGNVPNDMMVEYYRQRASAGLIITEATQISPQGVGYPLTPGMHSPAQVEGWKKITAAVHQAGGLIFAQLWHVGRISHPSLQQGEALPVAPSAVRPTGQAVTFKGMQDFVTPRALETAEIPGIIADYGRAAANAKAAGFDGVEIHAANGYLIDQFLQNNTNLRTDSYGGSIENRTRFLLEVTKAAASNFSADRVGIRLSPSGTFNDMGGTDRRAVFTHAVKELDKLGLSYLHLVQPTEADERHAHAGWESLPLSVFRPIFKGMLIGSAGLTRETAAGLIQQGTADAAAFAKLYLANPDLLERFKRNAPLNTPDPATFYGGTDKGYIDYPTLK